MKISHQESLGHLGYCTNIHAGEAWPEMIASLRKHVPAVREAVAPGQSFGLGLRLGAAVTRDLQNPALLQELREFLQQTDTYVFSINGFPYGPFHAQTVKENVYAPDWSTPERLEYTNNLAEILAALMAEQPPGAGNGDDYGSISTVPGTFKPWARDNIQQIADNLLEHVICLVRLRQRTGKTIALALEPEPFCLLETIAETVDFFSRHLFCDSAVSKIAAVTDLSAADAAAALRLHIGVCYDVCHAAVEFEDPVHSVQTLQHAGISIAKIQLSSALRIERVAADVAALLENFDEPVYLHQVIENRDGSLRRFVDLPQALADVSSAEGAEWRVHFHVPVFLEQMQDFGTTQFFLREILRLHKKKPISRQLEIETYTWDVLPAQYRNIEVSAAVAREMQWVLEQLRA